MTIKELFKMNGLDENGKEVLSDDEKRAAALSNFGLNPLHNYEDPGEAPAAGGYPIHNPVWDKSVTYRKYKKSYKK
jgi:hypothetical protein